ncbi:uncharacterized protein LOC114723286 [Neltuma alba]|uniref:uncharacterized protein LOC114723286 n=1 Tax=Neltuma alba TaxID=207710 RepID=UPI0010A588EA|nr:uncharacterized protein LOC114723286 [Prosopis alba]
MIEHAWDREEKFWWQRSRVNWLQSGDRNTKFFHTSTLQRRARNKVVKLRKGDGEWIEKEDEINTAFSQFYFELFASEDTRDMEEALQFVQKIVSEDENAMLTRHVTVEEIKGAVFQLNGSKAPGPDGYSGLFFHAAWGEVNQEVIKMVQDFFVNNASLQPVNKTNVVLIPKVDNADNVDQFRPIGLLNQRAFVAGRLIQDNLIIAHEAFHYLKNKKKGKKIEMAVKIDMKKAYDRLEWCFIEEVMRKMGFGEKWIGWIMQCVTSASLNLVVSWKKVAGISMGRGIRQGDPLSPYLFIIAADVLSLMIQKQVECGRLKGIKLASRCPVLSHCFFADDALLFMNAKRQNCRELKKILDGYCKASGQAINLEKSCIFFSKNICDAVKLDVYEELGIGDRMDPGRYLGLPMIWGKSKVEALSFVKCKMGKKLQGWKQKLLSFAGREVLIKAVANAIPIYPMSCFMFPKKTCSELDSMISNFWWGQRGQEGRIHWKAWKVMSKMKSEGGMGFRSLEAFNKALLAKTAWRLIQNPNDLWCRILKGLYFAKTDFLQAKKGSKASWGWTSILEGRELLSKDLGWKLGNGECIKVFTDSWLHESKEGKLKSRILSEDMKNICVRDLIKDGEWCFDGFGDWFTAEDRNEISRNRIPVIGTTDKIIWKNSRDGTYAMKWGYRVALKQDEAKKSSDPSGSYTPSKILWNGIWQIRMPPKVRHFLWRAVNGALATKDSLFKKKCALDPKCEICKANVETVEHALFLCPWAVQCWFGSPLTLKFEALGDFRTDRWLEDWFKSGKKDQDYEKAIFSSICWGIWKARCKYMFEHVDVDALSCVTGALRLVRDQWDAVGNKKGPLVVDQCLDCQLRWSKPVMGTVKVNIDAAYCARTRKAAIGMIGRDWAGRFLGGVGKMVDANSAFMAESLGLLEALENRDLWWGGRLMVETDYQELFYKVKREELKGCEWFCEDVVMKCISLLKSSQYKDVEVTLVARNGNCAADWLAAQTMGGLVPQGWLSKPPTSLIELLRKDLESLGPVKEIRSGIG